MKNSKLLTRGRLITKPDYQKWMEQASQLFESQLRSVFQTTETGTTTGPLPLSSMYCAVPLDDSRKWIVEHSARTLLVSKGEEGADIVIESI